MLASVTCFPRYRIDKQSSVKSKREKNANLLTIQLHFTVNYQLPRLVNAVREATSEYDSI